jgi:hypothetical protein
MIPKFIKTKVGASLILAVIFIIGAVIFRTSQQTTDKNLQNTIGLIADASVKNGIKNGDIVPTDWENSLKINSPKNFGGITNLVATSTESSTTEENLTATDRFSREFFTQYLNIKKSGATVDENTGLNLVDKLLTQDYGSQPEEKVYSDSDMVIIYSNNTNSLREYGNSLGSIVNKPLPPNYEQEIVVLSKVNDTGNTEYFKKLGPNVKRYQEMRDKMLALPVPMDLKNVHLAFINSISAMLEGVKGMTLMDTDPVGATKMIARYEDGLKLLPLAIQTMASYFAKQGVIFSPSESGFILMH